MLIIIISQYKILINYHVIRERAVCQTTIRGINILVLKSPFWIKENRKLHVERFSNTIITYYL